jgi:hypothetical protein
VLHRLALARNDVEARDINTTARTKSAGNTTIQPPGYKFPAKRENRKIEIVRRHPSAHRNTVLSCIDGGKSEILSPRVSRHANS